MVAEIFEAKLESLDVSLTKVTNLAHLSKATGLRSLAVHGLRLASPSSALDVISQLGGLTRLDVSTGSPDGWSATDFPAWELLQRPNVLPGLTFLDISGTAAAEVTS
jgi:hypothetical protein